MDRVEAVIDPLRARAIPFEVSLIYGLPLQTLDRFKASLDGCRSRGVPRHRLIDTEKMCPAGVFDSVFDDPMDDNETSGLDNLHGIYGYEGYLDFVTETRVHCVPVPHDPAIKLLTMNAYEDGEAGVAGYLVVTPPAGSGILAG
jgi:hypothetical protein